MLCLSNHIYCCMSDQLFSFSMCHFASHFACILTLWEVDVYLFIYHLFICVNCCVSPVFCHCSKCQAVKVEDAVPSQPIYDVERDVSALWQFEQCLFMFTCLCLHNAVLKSCLCWLLHERPGCILTLWAVPKCNLGHLDGVQQQLNLLHQWPGCTLPLWV